MQLSIGVESEAIQIAEASVCIEKSIDPIEYTYELNDLPDFLQNENTCLDLTSIMINLTITNNSPGTIETNIKLQSEFIDGSTSGDGIETLQHLRIDPLTKQDIVITNRLTEPDKLFIYGWHYPDGTPIQPLSGAHNAEYVDYSHGVRLVNKELMVDGKLYDVKTILQDANLYKLLSDESGIMMKTEYDTGDTSVPETPASFAVTPKDASSIEVRLKREANVTYVAQYGLSVSSHY